MTDLPLTFGVLDAVQITEDAIVSITDDNGPLPEDPTGLWVSGKNYAIGDEVHRVETHSVYSCVVAGSSTKLPEQDPTKWTRMRPTNRIAAFDVYRSTRTEGEGELTIVLRPGGLISAVWLGGLVATEAFVTVQEGVGGPEVFPETSMYLAGYGRYDWQTFFLSPVRIQEAAYFGDIPVTPDPVITIRLTQLGGLPSVGMIQVGQFVPLGATQYDTDIGRIRYSSIRTEEDGTQSFTPRPSAGDVNIRALIPWDKANEVEYLLSKYDAVPTLWVGHTDNKFGVLNKFGLFEGRFRFVHYEVCELSGTITGMI